MVHDVVVHQGGDVNQLHDHREVHVTGGNLPTGPTRQQGQESISLDRGLASGLEPGMVLYVSVDEEPLLSPVTGAIIGRDSPRAAGQIQVFRVLDETAYARPVMNTKLPRTAKLFARSF